MRSTDPRRRPPVVALLTTIISVLGGAGPSAAFLVPVDVAAPLDALATLDTATGLYWLDLTETTGLSYDAVEAGAGGWIGAGWRHATIEEVCELFEGNLPPKYPPGMSCPIVGTDFPTIVSGSHALPFFQLLGTTDGNPFPGPQSETSGLAAAIFTSPCFGIVKGFGADVFAYEGRTTFPPLGREDADPTIGHFLVRDTPPVPPAPALPGVTGSTIGLLVGALTGAGLVEAGRRRGRIGSS